MKFYVTGSATDATTVHKFAHLKAIVMLIPADVPFSKIFFPVGMITPLISYIGLHPLPVMISLSILVTVARSSCHYGLFNWFYYLSFASAFVQDDGTRVQTVVVRFSIIVVNLID
jgi:hypothetical protein